MTRQRKAKSRALASRTTLYFFVLLLTLLTCIWQGARKFDIRAWILVTNWNPLTVWMYEPYFRVCTEEHSLDKKSLSNHYKHLCNRCVQATNEDYDDGDEEGGCMWSVETMTAYLNKFGDGAELWENIRRQIMHISQMCMHSVQDLVDNKLVCVCVCERESVRERKNNKERDRAQGRKRARERECVYVPVHARVRVRV